MSETGLAGAKVQVKLTSSPAFTVYSSCGTETCKALQQESTEKEEHHNRLSESQSVNYWYQSWKCNVMKNHMNLNK